MEIDLESCDCESENLTRQDETDIGHVSNVGLGSTHRAAKATGFSLADDSIRFGYLSCKLKSVLTSVYCLLWETVSVFRPVGPKNGVDSGPFRNSAALFPGQFRDFSSAGSPPCIIVGSK